MEYSVFHYFKALAVQDAKRSRAGAFSDLKTKWWHNVEDTLPKECDLRVAAMDAGLVCTFGKARTHEQLRASTIDSSYTREKQILVVSNLINKNIRVLPNLHLHVKLREDSFEIGGGQCLPGLQGLSHCCECSLETSRASHVFLYNPQSYRSLPPATILCTLPCIKGFYIFCLLGDKCRSAHKLYSYNEFADSWEALG